jgi:outer membrane protein
MKKVFIVACLMVLAFASQAQYGRYAIVDTKYILDKLPEYKDAQKKLDQFSEQ